MVQGVLGEGGERRIGMARIRQFAMNLVSHYENAVSPANGGHLLQFFPCPDASGGIMGIAQEHQLDGGIGRFPFQILRIQRISAVLIFQRAGFRNASVIADGGKKAIIHRRLHQHLVSGNRQGPYDGRQRGNHPRGINHPFRINLPAVAAFKPVHDRLIIGIRNPRIPENAVFGPFPNGFRHRRSRTEIHVCHPHGQNILPGHGIPLVGIRAAARNNSVKIVLHAASPDCFFPFQWSNWLEPCNARPE